MIGATDRPRCPLKHRDSNGIWWQCSLYPIRLPHGGWCAYPPDYTPPKRGSGKKYDAAASSCVVPLCCFYDGGRRPLR